MLQTMFNVSLLCFFRLNEYPCPTEIQLRIKLAALLSRMNERTRLLLLLETPRVRFGAEPRLMAAAAAHARTLIASMSKVNDGTEDTFGRLQCDFARFVQLGL